MTVQELYDAIIWNMFGEAIAIPPSIGPNIMGANGLIARTCKRIMDDNNWWFMRQATTIAIPGKIEKTAYLAEDSEEALIYSYQVGTLATGDATVTVADSSVLYVGMAVSGTGVPDGTTVLSITDATTIELSAGATATGDYDLTFGESIEDIESGMLIYGTNPASWSTFAGDADQTMTKEAEGTGIETLRIYKHLYALPDGFKTEKSVNVRWENGNITEITKVPRALLDSSYTWDNLYGEPKYYNVMSGYLSLFSAPEDPGDLVIDYYGYVLEDVNGAEMTYAAETESVVTQEASDLIINAVCIQIAGFLYDTLKAQFYANEYATAYKMLLRRNYEMTGGNMRRMFPTVR